jgi:endonuclease/exonuclease/phosphatase family metal-dependent hydrolase
MEVSLLQWNVMYNENVSRVADVIKQLNPDIVCLQELTDDYQGQGDSAKTIAERLGYYSHYQYGLMLFPDGNQGRMGNGIFSRFPLLATDTTYLDRQKRNEAGQLTALDRFYLQAKLDLPDKRQLSVGITHLPFHPRMITSPYKRAMVDRMLAAMPQDRDLIVAGDLNTTPASAAARMLRQAGLRNAGPALKQPTWTTKPFTIGPWSYDGLRWRFDYVLYRSPGATLKVRQARIVETNLSDHLPILTTFRIG